MKLHPEIAERMRTNNPTKNGMSQEWRDKLTAAVRGKVRSLEARLRYRESKLGIKNPNFKDGSTGGRSRIPEVNHKVVSVEWLAEKGDVYCLTVPSTGWFYANNVLVKNCSFCVSGKNRGKLRAFPIEQVEAEIQYVSKHFQDRKDVLFYLVDENFGILARDREIAHMIVRERERSGYPNKIFYYNDKRFTQLSRDVHEIVGDMCHHGVMLSLQSENPETLKAIKRRNLTDEQIVSALGWAKSLDLKTSTELIFGLPMETRESFLALIDKCARIGFEAIQCYNLIIFDGIEMNRTTYRQAHELVTKRRLIHGNKGTVEGQFVVESEEVVVSSNSFDDDTYRLIRSFNVFFHAVYIFGLKRKEINEAIANGRPITDILIALTKNPVSEGHAAFLKDLNEAIDAELLNEDDVKAIIAGTKAEPPVVKIQPVFAGRLIEAANGWAGEAFDSVLYNRNDSLILAE
jgi:hypothetical protein